VTCSRAAITDEHDWNILARPSFSDDVLNRREVIERLLADRSHCRYACFLGRGIASGNDSD
jgi:hypothetical protein